MRDKILIVIAILIISISFVYYKLYDTKATSVTSPVATPAVTQEAVPEPVKNVPVAKAEVITLKNEPVEYDANVVKAIKLFIDNNKNLDAKKLILELLEKNKGKKITECANECRVFLESSMEYFKRTNDTEFLFQLVEFFKNFRATSQILLADDNIIRLYQNIVNITFKAGYIFLGIETGKVVFDVLNDVSINQLSGDKKFNLSKLYFAVGDQSRIVGLVQQSIQYLQKSTSLVNPNNDEIYYFEKLVLADAYMYNNEFDKAEEIFKIFDKAELNKFFEEKYVIQWYYYYKAVFYSLKRDFQNSNKFANSMLAISKQKTDHRAIAYANLILGKNLILEKKLAEAKAYFMTATEEIKLDAEPRAAESKFTYNLAMYYLLSNDDNNYQSLKKQIVTNRNDYGKLELYLLKVFESVKSKKAVEKSDSFFINDNYPDLKDFRAML